MKFIEEERVERLIQLASSGEESALAFLFDLHRERLQRMIFLRLDPRIRSRLDAADVLQEAFIDVRRRFHEFVAEPRFSFYYWLRNITANRLKRIHRFHLDTQSRDAKREISIVDQRVEVSSCFLACQLAGSTSSVANQLVRAEIQHKIEIALQGLESKDREVIALRHFEELSTEEISQILEISRSGVLKRYRRALERLREAIGEDCSLL